MAGSSGAAQWPPGWSDTRQNSCRRHRDLIPVPLWSILLCLFFVYGISSNCKEKIQILIMERGFCYLSPSFCVPCYRLLSVDHKAISTIEKSGKTIDCSLAGRVQSPPPSHVRRSMIGCQTLLSPTVSRFACKEFSSPLIIRCCLSSVIAGGSPYCGQQIVDRVPYENIFKARKEN